MFIFMKVEGFSLLSSFSVSRFLIKCGCVMVWVGGGGVGKYHIALFRCKSLRFHKEKNIFKGCCVFPIDPLILPGFSRLIEFKMLNQFQSLIQSVESLVQNVIAC